MKNISKENVIKILDEVNMMIALLSLDNTLISANRALLEFANVKLEDVKDLPYWELPWVEDSPDLKNKLLFGITEAYMGEVSRFSANYTDQNGELHEIDFIIKPILEDEEPAYILTMGYNITALVQAQKALTKRDRRLKAFFDYSLEGYFFLSLPDTIDKNLVDDTTIVEIIEQYRLEGVNQRLLDIVGRETIAIEEIFSVIGIHDNLVEIIAEVIEKGSITLQGKIEGAKTKYLNIIIVAIYEKDIFEGNFAIVRDVTQEKEYIEEIEFLAKKDYLTGINNRRSFFEKSYKNFALWKKNNIPITVVMLDIDHFKKVNDTYGHDAGDIVIKGIAKYIESKVGNKSIIGRYGGEEYVVVLPNNISESYQLFESMRREIKEKVFLHDDDRIQVTVSVGLSSVSKSDTLETAITRSDKALYESKENGRNQCTIFLKDIHGIAAIDPITQLNNEKSITFKLFRLIHDTLNTGDSLWLIYFEIDSKAFNKDIPKERQLKTMAVSIRKSVRENDHVGRIGEYGFLVILRNNSAEMANDIYERIIDYLEIGYFGMDGFLLNIYGTLLEVDSVIGNKNSSEIMGYLKDKKEIIEP